MFSELTLILHISLITLIYLFLFSLVRVIARDILSPIGASSGTTTGEPRLLVSYDGGGSTIAYPVGVQVVIGRADDCDVILEDTFVSNHHARVYRDDAATWLEDLNSTNGTTYKNRRVNVPVSLHDGDVFKIGNNQFKYLE